jgi:ribonucleoside-triphosphate reductase
MNNKDQYGMDEYQRFIHLSRYARWNEEKNRRETWEETVERFCNFWDEKYPGVFPKKKIYNAILNLKCVPSMRALMTAGPALERDNMAGYNCSFVAIDHPRAFDEIAYILMCGTGVGFSVERESVNQLPVIAEEFHHTNTVIQVADSKQGWASSYRELISLLYSGRIPKWDVSKVRPAGSKLKTFGGRASGPEPLVELFEFTIDKFTKAAGRKLNSLECHDIVCKMAQIVVVGGVRRSAFDFTFQSIR